MLNESGSTGRPKRLLVITYHFTPDGAVGGLRWSGMSKYLARRGWEVHVITAATQDGQPVIPGVHVHHCQQRRTLNDVYNDWANRRRGTVALPAPPGSAKPTAAASAAGPADTATTPTASPVARFLNGIRRTVSVSLALPDYSRGWIFAAARMARAQLTAQEFDAVVTSGPPHGAHIAGAIACLGRSGLLWVDLRDPWMWWPGITWHTALAKGLFAAGLAGIERVVFSTARGIVTNTSAFAQQLRGGFPKRRIYYVPNGIDRERLPRPSTNKFDGLSISYVGSLYVERNLSSVIRALRDLVAAHPEARDAIKLRVAGGMEERHAARFWSDVNSADLASMVEVYGRVSGSEALELINRSHLTLVLAQRQPLQVPAKLYECVAMGVQTLVIGDTPSASESEARRIGALVCESNDVDGIRSVIEHLWLNPTGFTQPTGSIGYDAIAGEMDALLSDDTMPPAKTAAASLPTVSAASG